MYLRSARNKAAYFDSLSTVSEQKRRVINASLCICCLVWTDPSPPPDGSMHPHCEPYPANDKRYLNSVLTKKNGFGDTPNDPTVDKAGLEYNLFFSQN